MESELGHCYHQVNLLTGSASLFRPADQVCGNHAQRE